MLSNELGAPYAVGEYSRVKGVPECLSTTSVRFRSSCHRRWRAERDKRCCRLRARCSYRRNTTDNANEDQVVIASHTGRWSFRSTQQGHRTLPTDLVGAVVSATPLEVPLDLTIPENDTAGEAAVLDGVAKQVTAVQERVIVIVNGCALRCEMKGFPEKTSSPFLLLLWVSLLLANRTNDLEAYVSLRSSSEF